MEQDTSPAPKPEFIDAHGIFFRGKDDKRGEWMTPSGHTTRLRIHAAWARTEAELEKFKEVAAKIRGNFPGALVEVRKL